MRRLACIQHQHTNLGKLNGPFRVIHHQPLNRIHNPCLTAHTGCIHQLIILSLKAERNGNGITGNACLRSGQQTGFAQQSVNQRRFSHVRAPNNGNTHRASLGIILNPDIRLIILIACLWHICKFDRCGLTIIFIIFIFAKKRRLQTQITAQRQERIMNIHQPFTMRRRNRHRGAKAQRPCLCQTRCPLLAFAFIGQHNNRHAAAP